MELANLLCFQGLVACNYIQSLQNTWVGSKLAGDSLAAEQGREEFFRLRKRVLLLS